MGNSKRGPEADRLVIPGNWKDAMGEALGKKRPAKGWPKATKAKPSKKKK